MAEEFAFDEVFGDGGAIDFDERGIVARALAVEGAGDEFLAGAALAGDEDGGLCAGDLADQLAEIFHRRADALEFVTGVVLFGVAEVGVDLEELVVILGLLESDLQLVGREGLEHVVKGAIAHAFDCGFDGAEAGDHDDEGFFGLALEFAQKLGAFAVGKAEVQEDQIEGVPGERFAGGGERVGGGNVVTLLAQELFKISPDDQVVFENEDFFNGHGCGGIMRPPGAGKGQPRNEGAGG